MRRRISLTRWFTSRSDLSLIGIARRTPQFKSVVYVCLKILMLFPCSQVKHCISHEVIRTFQIWKDQILNLFSSLHHCSADCLSLTYFLTPLAATPPLRLSRAGIGPTPCSMPKARTLPETLIHFGIFLLSCVFRKFWAGVRFDASHQ